MERTVAAAMVTLWVLPNLVGAKAIPTPVQTLLCPADWLKKLTVVA